MIPESEFTPSTSTCPRPEYWMAADAESTEIEVADLVYGLVRGLQPDYCLETGTAFGMVAEKIGQAIRDNGHGRLVTLEADEYRARLARYKLTGFRDFIDVVNTDSRNWEPDQTINFAWFDSSNRLHDRIDEYERFEAWMRAGTIVCFHDTAPGHGGSGYPGTDFRSALAERLRRRVRLVHLPTPRGVTIGEVFHPLPKPEK